MARKTIVSKSLRPKSREEAFKQKQERDLNEESARLASEDFGDTEFRAELEDQLSWNPIARLGYDPKSGKADKLNNSTGGYAAYVPESEKQDSLDNLLKSNKGFSNFVGKVSPGDVFLTTNLAETPIWSHEYTHKGVDKLDQYYKKDPEGFKEKYGIDAANLLERMAKGSVKEEAFTELFDDLSEELHGIKKNMSGYADHELSPSAERGRERLQEALKNSRASDLSGFGVYNLESGLGVRLKGSVGLAIAAEDLLKEQGEPPRSEQAEPSLFDKLKSKMGFAEGGEVKTMEEQMSLFEEGGIADDGMERDPVSGNDIPPGSMASEVRDDVPTMLSEGEYVVPADVLRFYGVNFFEELRARAKSGLQEMEENGRIGGEPMSDQDIQRNMGQDQEAMGANKGGLASGFNWGGLPEGTKEKFNLKEFDPSNVEDSIWQTGGGGGDSVTTFKTFVDSTTGQTQIVEYVDGRLKNPMLEKFTQPPYYEFGSSSLKKAQDASSKTTDEERDGGGFGEDNDPTSNTSNEDWGLGVDMSDPVGFAENALSKTGPIGGKLGQGLATMAGPAGIAGLGTISGIRGLDNVADARAAATIAEARGDTESAKSITDSIAETMSNSSGFMRGLDALGLASGDKNAKSYMDRNSYQYSETKNGKITFTEEQVQHNKEMEAMKEGFAEETRAETQAIQSGTDKEVDDVFADIQAEFDAAKANPAPSSTSTSTSSSSSGSSGSSSSSSSSANPANDGPGRR